MVFRCPNIQAHHKEAVICLSLGHLNILKFPFGTNGKFPFGKNGKIIFKCRNT